LTLRACAPDEYQIVSTRMFEIRTDLRQSADLPIRGRLTKL